MSTYVYVAATAAYLAFLFAIRIHQLRRLHSVDTPVDPNPAAFGPGTLHRHRL